MDIFKRLLDERVAAWASVMRVVGVSMIVGTIAYLAFGIISDVFRESAIDVSKIFWSSVISTLLIFIFYFFRNSLLDNLLRRIIYRQSAFNLEAYEDMHFRIMEAESNLKRLKDSADTLLNFESY